MQYLHAINSVSGCLCWRAQCVCVATSCAAAQQMSGDYSWCLFSANFEGGKVFIYAYLSTPADTCRYLVVKSTASELLLSPNSCNPAIDEPRLYFYLFVHSRYILPAVTIIKKKREGKSPGLNLLNSSASSTMADLGIAPEQRAG